VSAYAGFERDHVLFTQGQLSTYESSAGVKRGFCAACGSTLTYEGARWPGEIHFHVGAFDLPQDFPPKGQAFAEEGVPWLHVTET